jgi:hypothetical protein
MKSHFYQFTPRDLLQLIGPPLLPVAVLSLALHAGAAWHWLPDPWPARDVDSTVLVHQAEASRRADQPELLLLGDSSCLMDVSAPLLSQKIGRPVLNLGSFSYLDLNAYASLLRQHVQASPGHLRAVVLLMHPDALRQLSANSWYSTFLQTFLEGKDHVPATNVVDHLANLFGLEILRGRALTRLLPRPLPGPYGRFYGFTVDLDRFLTQNRGSAIDPDIQPLKGSAEYRLAPRFQADSRAFHAAVPSTVKLIVGITPVPEKFAGPSYPPLHQRMLTQWSQWLQADVALDQAPAALPDTLFARTTHLNEQGQRIYTERLAQALAPLLR